MAINNVGGVLATLTTAAIAAAVKSRARDKAAANEDAAERQAARAQGSQELRKAAEAATARQLQKGDALRMRWLREGEALRTHWIPRTEDIDDSFVQAIARAINMASNDQEVEATMAGWEQDADSDTARWRQQAEAASERWAQGAKAAEACWINEVETLRSCWEEHSVADAAEWARKDASARAHWMLQAEGDRVRWADVSDVVYPYSMRVLQRLNLYCWLSAAGAGKFNTERNGAQRDAVASGMLGRWWQRWQQQEQQRRRPSPAERLVLDMQSHAASKEQLYQWLVKHARKDAQGSSAFPAFDDSKQLWLYYHPDKQAGTSAEWQALCQDIFIAVRALW